MSIAAMPGTDRFAIVSSYLPRHCGLATFSHDLYTSITAAGEAVECFVVELSRRGEEVSSLPEVVRSIADDEPASYRAAADSLNMDGYSAVSLQAELGIFGGTHGEMIFDFFDALKIPVVTTLHSDLHRGFDGSSILTGQGFWSGCAPA